MTYEDCFPDLTIEQKYEMTLARLRLAEMVIGHFLGHEMEGAEEAAKNIWLLCPWHPGCEEAAAKWANHTALMELEAENEERLEELTEARRLRKNERDRAYRARKKAAQK